GRHAAVDGVEAVGVAEEVVGRLGTAADAGELRHLVREDVELPEGLDQGGGDGVVAAAGAKGGDFAFVGSTRVPDIVFLEGRVMQFRFGQVRHGGRGPSLRSGRRYLEGVLVVVIVVLFVILVLILVVVLLLLVLVFVVVLGVSEGQPPRPHAALS